MKKKTKALPPKPAKRRGAEPAERLRTAVAAGAFAVTVSGDWEGMPDRRALSLLEATEPVVR